MVLQLRRAARRQVPRARGQRAAVARAAGAAAVVLEVGARRRRGVERARRGRDRDRHVGAVDVAHVVEVAAARRRGHGELGEGRRRRAAHPHGALEVGAAVTGGARGVTVCARALGARPEAAAPRGRQRQRHRLPGRDVPVARAGHDEGAELVGGVADGVRRAARAAGHGRRDRVAFPADPHVVAAVVFEGERARTPGIGRRRGRRRCRVRAGTAHRAGARRIGVALGVDDLIRRLEAASVGGTARERARTVARRELRRVASRERAAAPSPTAGGRRRRTDHRRVPALGVGAVAVVQLHEGPVGGVVGGDVEALAAARVHERDEPAARVLQEEALRAGAVAVPELDLRAVGRAVALDVDALAGVGVEHRVGPASGVAQLERLGSAAVAAPLLDLRAVGGARRLRIHARSRVRDRPEVEDLPRRRGLPRLAHRVAGRRAAPEARRRSERGEGDDGSERGGAGGTATGARTGGGHGRTSSQRQCHGRPDRKERNRRGIRRCRTSSP